MKIYISGPITGIKGYMERFRQAEELLIAAGHTVINPARVNGALPAETTHEEYMKMSFVMMSMCDTIFVLNGWEKSKGAWMEINEALENGQTITFEGGEKCQSTQSSFNLTKIQEEKYMKETEESAYSAEVATTKLAQAQCSMK